MSNLTYLNDASVLHNLKARYTSKLIYVSEQLQNDFIVEVALSSKTSVAQRGLQCHA